MKRNMSVGIGTEPGTFSYYKKSENVYSSLE